jgi:hypothetical protein
MKEEPVGTVEKAREAIRLIADKLKEEYLFRFCKFVLLPPNEN